MKTKAGFVPELVLPRVERLRDALVPRGLPADKYGWLADALLSSGCVPDDDDAFETLHQICTSAFVHWKRLDDRDGTVLALLEAINHHMSGAVWLYQPSTIREQWPITPEARTKFIQACVANGVDFTNALVTSTRADPDVSVTPNNQARLGLQTARMLSRDGLLVPERLCDLARLEVLADSVDWRGGNWSSGDTDKECADVASPTFWIVVGAKEFLRCLMPRLEAADDVAASRLAHGVVVTTMRLSHMMTPLYDMGTGPEIRRAVFQNLDRRVGLEPRKAADPLRRAWMRLSLELQSGNLGALDEACRARIKTAADYEFGRLRAESKHPHDESSAEKFNRLLPTIEASADIMFQLSPLWDAMRPLLLVFRELKTVAVAPDMRYWSDGWQQPDAPLPWSRIPETLVSLFHACASQEQEHDPELNDLRTRFGRFCLERLKSKDAGGPPIEPDSRWRWAYVRAARELRINPEGKGHHILNHAGRCDPDPDVQEEAKTAYVEFRHGPTLPAGFSPRRTVTNALLWLFQAHYLSVAPPDVPIDRNGVQRTREEVARRTTEPKPPSSVGPGAP